jgi:hypothetical protein
VENSDAKRWASGSLKQHQIFAAILMLIWSVVASI